MRYSRVTVKIITPPENSIVSLSDMKEYLRVDNTADDNLIQDFIDAVSQSVRQYLKRSLITETLELTMDGFGQLSDDNLVRLGSGVHVGSYSHILGRPNEVDLPFLPIQSITSIKTFNRANQESTFDSANYELDETGGRIYLDEGVTWPDNLRAREAVKITYVSGYGDNASDIPAPIVQAVKGYVGKMYDCREMCEMPDMCKAILAPYKLYDELGYCG